MTTEITQTTPSLQQDQKPQLEEVTRTVDVLQIQDLINRFNFH